MTDVKAPASGGRRQRRARQTRQRILEAAADLFIAQGYAATTMQQIAERADVAWQTVYAVFGTKAGVLSAVFDVAVAGDDEPVPVAERPFVQAIRAAAEPREKAAIFARHLRESAARTADIMSVIDAAAATDPDVSELWRTLVGQGMRGMTLAATGFRDQGVLRPDLTVARAADILWLYVGPWAYRVLVTERGWTLDEYEQWLATTLYMQLMADQEGHAAR
ncbi:MAG TPA: helix-turn-helix domain-containing protein [Streptosporangiaceae bacterium]|jgi:TetR/AcrR family transcriptional regulator of autoinduction and epiphytic fitness|nr:helix-turn-helix domain-containing protein [Streptosporangiaceae bacterium]